MNKKDQCSLLGSRLRLRRRCQIVEETVSRGTQTKHGFIRDLQQLESVLGSSQADWFERLTEQRLDYKLSSRPLPCQPGAGGFDSPSSTPTISQLISVSNLKVGSSPVFNYDSPVQFSSSYRQSPVRTPDNWKDWQKPLLDLSPSPGRPLLGRGTLPQPSSAIVHSLGVLADDSALSWTNSLATPPRDDILGLSADLTPPENNHKETARALFPPSDKLNTTGDSVQPIDSTDEEDDLSTGHQSDLSMEEEPTAATVTSGGEDRNKPGDKGHNTAVEGATSIGDGSIISLVTRCSPTKSGTTPGSKGDNKSRSSARDKGGDKNGRIPSDKGDNSNSLRDKAVSVGSTDGRWTVQNVSGFAEISCEKDQGQISSDLNHDTGDRYDSRPGLGEKSRDNQANLEYSVDRRDLAQSADGKHESTAVDVQKETRINLDKSAEMMELEMKTVNGQNSTKASAKKIAEDNSLEFEVSPTFTQKVSRKCVKEKKPGPKKKRARWQEVCMDEVLSDFFDSPATATRKRRSSTGTGIVATVDAINTSDSATRKQRKSGKSGDRSPCDETDVSGDSKRTEVAKPDIDTNAPNSPSIETDPRVTSVIKGDALPGIGIIGKSSSKAGTFADDINASFNSPIPNRISTSEIKCSTPKDRSAPVLLQSILSSSKKKKGSSWKKVRFSENVKKYSISSSYQSILKKKSKPAIVAEPDAKKVKFEEVTLAYKEVKEEGDSGIGSSGDQASSFSKVDDVEMDETGDMKKGRDITKGAKPTGQAVDLIDVEVKMGETLDSKSTTVPMKHEQSLESSMSACKRQINEQDLNQDKEVEIKMVDTFGDDFSQISPSSLNEMCSVADQTGSYISGDVDKKERGLLKNDSAIKTAVSINNGTMQQSTDKEPANISTKRQAPKLKFLYPSTRNIVTSFPKKVFQYEENSQSAKQEGLVQPVLARNIVSNNDVLLGEDEKANEAQDNKIPTGMPETYNCSLEIVTPMKPPSKSPTRAENLNDENREKMEGCTSMVSEMEHTVSPGLRKDTVQASSSTSLVKGFQSASGKSLNLSAESLEKAARLLNEEDGDTSIKPASRQVEISSPSKLAMDFPVQGFQSASGKSLKLSVESLEKASRLLHEEETDASTRPALLQDRNSSSTAPKGFQSASEKSHKLTAESLEKAAKLWMEEEKSKSSKQNCYIDIASSIETSKGFHSASGKSFEVSAKSLEEASKLMDEGENETNTNFATRQDRKTITALPKALSIGFHSASGKSLKLSAESLEKASKLLNEENTDTNIKSVTRQYTDKTRASPKAKLEGFQSASGKSLQLSAESLGTAFKLLNEENCDINIKPSRVRNTASPIAGSKGFQSASGKPLELSAKSLEKASRMLSEDDSDKNIKFASRHDTDKEEASPKGLSIVGFQSASGKSLKLSAKSLEKASKLLHEESDTKPASRIGKVGNSVSPKAASKAIKLVEEECMDIGEREEDFSGDWPSDFDPEALEPEERDTFVGQNQIEEEITEGEKSMKYSISQNVHSNFINNERMMKQGTDSSTKKTESNLRQQEKDVGAAPNAFSSARSIGDDGKRVAGVNTSYILTNVTHKTGHAGFQTASRRKLECSEEALKKAEDCMSESKNKDTELSNTSNIPKPQIKDGMPERLKFQAKDGLKQPDMSAGKLESFEMPVGSSDVNSAMDFMGACTGFSTAGGKPLQMFEASIKKASSVLSDFMEETGDRTHNNTDDNNEMPNEFSNIKRSVDVMGAFAGFSTASGKQLQLPEANIKKARSVLSDVMEDTDKGTSVIIDHNNDMCAEGSNTKRPAEVMGACTGFSTAGGKQLKLSDANIRKARTVLSDFMGDSEQHTDIAVVSPEKSFIKDKNVGKLSVAERLQFEFQKDSLNESSDVCSITEELQKLKSKRTADSKKEDSTETVSVSPNKKSTITKSTTLQKQNLPQGFRPFKAPRPSGSKSPGKNKYPESKCSDWNTADKSTNNTAFDKDKANQKKVETNTEVFKNAELLVDETHKSNNLTVKPNTPTCTEANKSDVNCTELYEGLSQVFSEELDASFEENHVINCDNKSAVPLKNMPTADKKIAPQISMGFSTASGKPFNLSETSVLSAEKLFADAERPLVIGIDSNGDHVKTTLENADTDSPSNKNQATTLNTENCKVENNAVSPLNLRESNRPVTNGFIGDGGVIPSPCCKASLNTSIASLENDSVGRHEQMDEKLDNELLSSQDLSVSHKPAFSNSVEKSVAKLELGGFKTASGKHVNVSESAVSNAQQKFGMENVDSLEMQYKEQQEVTSAKKEAALKSYEPGDKEDDADQPDNIEDEVNQPCDMEDRVHEQKPDTIPKVLNCDTKMTREVLCGFQTASGKNLHVSDEAVEKAEQTLTVDTDETLQDCSNDINGCSESVTRKEPYPSVSATTFDNKHGKSLNMFQTSSGKTVKVSDQAILAAKRKLDTDIADDLRVSSEEIFSKQAPLESLKKLRLSKQHDFREVKTSNNVSNENTTVSSLPENSNPHFKDDHHIEDIDMDTLNEVPTEMCFFQTASGKNVNVSEESLQAAKKNMVDNDIVAEVLSDEHILDTETNFKSSGFKEGIGNAFQTASGGKVKVSGKALAFARKTFEDTDDSINPNVDLGNAFQTASGRKVRVSENALSFAKKTLEDTDETMKQTVDHRNPFQTASGELVKVSEKALAFARKTLDENDCTKTQLSTNPFKTASGGHVNVSDKAVAMARKTLDDNCNDESISSNPFKTAAGGHVKVSDKALAFARKALQDDEKLNENLQKWKENTYETIDSFNAFQTASGSAVKVSERALLFARKSFNDTNDKINTTEDFSDKAMETPDSTSMRKGINETFSSANPFQTSSGSKVKVSQKALAFARKSLEESTSGAQQMESSCPFQSASGKMVKVSDKALAFARSMAEKDELGTDKSDVNAANSLLGINKKHGMIEAKSDVVKAHSSDRTDQLDSFEDELLKLRSERDKVLKNRLNSNKDETADEDFAKSAGLLSDDSPPGKRQRLEGGLEKAFDAILEKGPLKRKPVRTRPEGITTDRRHPGFRPFKPVRCKVQDSPAARLDTILQTRDACGPKKDMTSGSKPSFNTPYRSSTAAPPTPAGTTDKFKVTMPIFRNSLAKGDMTHITQTPNRNSVNDKLDSGNCLTDTAPEETKTEFNAQTKSKTNEMVLPVRTPDGQSTSDKVETDPSSDVVDVDMGDEENDSIGEMNAETSARKAVAIDDEMDSDLASYSQDEEDLFYCHLVEARRQQGEIIQEKTGKKAVRVKPLAGRLYEMKQRQGRWRLRDLVNMHETMGQPSVGGPVCAASAAGYRFKLDDHYTCHTARVLVGDGALLVPDDSGMAGRQEFYSAFLTLSGVDPKLISEAWLYNHYRWVVWKLAAYEACIPHMTGRCLTPEMVMLQLKYRYDREIDLAQRSAIRKIFEKDDTSSKRMVLCVAGIQHVNADSGGAGIQAGTVNTRSLDSKVILELTDGWYSIKAAADVPMTDLVHSGRLGVGQKMCISGAEIIGGENACSPLEAPEGVMLKLCCNSARPCPWDTPLGYQRDPRPLCVPLSSLYGEGGTVGVVDVVVVRKYPVMYMEKFAGGGSVFRTGRCEEKARQDFERLTEAAMQKLYQEVEEQADKENQLGLKRPMRGSKKWTRTEVEGLGTGQEIYDGLNSAQQPDSFQNYLSDRQLELLYEYQRTVQEQKQAELNSRVQEAWRDRQETAPDRNVTPVLKLRVCGCSRKDMDSGTSTILTVWRPAPEILELQEGKRYKIYSLNTSTSRSKYTSHTVQLTATKQTKFQLMSLDENFLDNIYEPREVLWVSDVTRRRPAYGELDFVGQVVRANPASAADSGKPCDTVYLVDCQGNILIVRVWNGFKSFGEDLFVPGGVLCCSNLMDKSTYRAHHLPTVEAATEFTLFSKRPQTPGHTRVVERLNSAIQENEGFLVNAQKKLDDLLSGKTNYMEPNRMMHTPSKRLSTSLCPKPVQEAPSPGLDTPGNSDTTPCTTPTKIPSTSDQGHNKGNQSSNSIVTNTSPMTTPQSDVAKAKKSVYQAKMARLLSYSSPGVLSPINTPVTRGVRKGFKPPAFKKTGED